MEVLERFDQQSARATLARGEQLWIDLDDPDTQTLAALGEMFHLHPLAIEDTEHFRQLPKIDDYPEAVLLVFFGARTGAPADGFPGLPEPVEVHLHITAQVVISVRRTHLPELTEACRRVRERTVTTSEEAVYRVLDALATSFMVPLRTVEDELDSLQDQALSDPRPALRERLLDIKHRLLVMRQVVDPQRDLMASRRDLIERLPNFSEDAAHDYLRDVHDHLARTSQQIESVRELVANALDLYLSSVSNRLNEIMKVLTILATFFLPLTLLTGFFGQNFGWLVRNVSSLESFLVLGVGLAAAIIAVLSWAFISAGYMSLPRLRRRRAPEPAAGP